MKLLSRESFLVKVTPGAVAISSSEGQITMRSYRRAITYGLASGFTLIELLVVIAIIGLLSAVVLGSLNSATKKGSGATIQKEMVSLRQAVELYNQAHGGYSATTGSCTAGMFADASTNIAGIVGEIRTNAGGLTNIDCASNSNAWSVSAVNPSGGYLCIDAGNTVLSSSNASHSAYTGLFASSGNVTHRSASANTATVCF